MWQKCIDCGICYISFPIICICWPFVCVLDTASMVMLSWLQGIFWWFKRWNKLLPSGATQLSGWFGNFFFFMFLNKARLIKVCFHGTCSSAGATSCLLPWLWVQRQAWKLWWVPKTCRYGYECVALAVGVVSPPDPWPYQWVWSVHQILGLSSGYGQSTRSYIVSKCPPQYKTHKTRSIKVHFTFYLDGNDQLSFDRLASQLRKHKQAVAIMRSSVLLIHGL